MLIIILFVVVALIGVGLMIYYDKSYRAPYWVCEIGLYVLIIGMVSLLISGVWILTAQVTKDTDYQKVLEQREMLVYRLDHYDDNIVGNELLYNDILEFNNELRDAKRWSNNPWTNWFNNDKIAELDYIEYREDKDD